MDIRKDHLKIDFISGHIGEFVENFVLMIKKPNIFFKSDFKRLSKETLYSGEIANYYLLFLTGLISSTLHGGAEVIFAPLRLLLIIQIGPLFCKKLFKLLKSKDLELDEYRDCFRILSGGLGVISLITLITPTILGLLVSLGYSIYILYIFNFAMKDIFELNCKTRFILLGLTDLYIVTLTTIAITSFIFTTKVNNLINQ